METTYGVLALLPAIVAIALCFATKQVLISLFAGLFAGCLVINHWNPIFGVTYALETIVTNMSENVTLLLFTLFMGVGISFIWRLGGSFALADAAKRKFKKRRSICLGTWGLGMATSINDCLVAAVDGNVFRDICKDYRISSEKFSYVLDATAAPSAALFLSDWIAYQIGMIGQGLDIAGITEIQPVAAYIKSIPFNMYSILTLIFVGVLMYTGKDYGPMLKAEMRCMTTGEFTRPGANPMLDVSSDLGEPKKTRPMIKSFVLPIVLALTTIIAGILYTGRAGFPNGIMAVLENCDAQTALLWGSFVMAVSGMIIALVSKIMTFEETMATVVDGFKLMSLTGAILVMAWSLGAITKEMGLAAFVVQLVGDSIPFGLLPPIVFGISIIIAFATGTSWGTMAIMTPLAIPLAYSITGDINITVGMCGAVLSGALFGDHSSPVSDTTVMASLFSGADHIDHVKTQLPYVATVGFVIAILYTIFGFTGISPFILLPIGVVMEILLMHLLHKYYLKKYDIHEDYSLSMTADHK
ncbi:MULTISPECIES: Na+/H+ antiporter NhaC family protein [Clostridium]|uniref:Transporter, NhaC family n=1 Tax=Clostridium cadaveris TaxID=1529 RepID=A0A1I2MKY7_9CLOT|nr:Na+/H+ antiporter NhaC family protein [Clostridium cadaveris]MDU4951852.1 Na+/H+ antiporter NhaC family protein [Clostridium sp.]MDM8312495.1 Na+/H+ antiporter NhaC family protein [Clostridium cadaveris]MDY4947743.1 Na+/H+ antiporter NhaC family protein [Clostridium cadaveris]NME64284.1 Na+/H+ antiporter NhaC family protein [Clostridium cadaveris]NWK11053.1 Na+/H+ antiporter NhaC family protein [Clostridium cadaveris]